MNFFLGGALWRPTVLRCVLGANVATAPRQIAGFDNSGPLVCREAGIASGVVVQDPDPEMRARLQYYAQVFDLSTVQGNLTGAGGTQTEVAVLVSNETAAQVAVDASEAVQGRIAAEIMGYFGTYGAEFVRPRLYDIHRRAASYVASQALPADSAHTLTDDVVVHRHLQPYMNFFTMEEMDLQFRRYDQTLSDVVNRGILGVGHVVAVLPYDPVRDSVLLIEQFRAPLFASGNRSPWIWQPVAGLIDPGETAVQAANREAREEADLTLKHLEAVGQVYSSPGSSSEFVHLYVALADLPTPTEAQSIGGLEAEQEDIRRKVIPYEQFMQGIDDGKYRDMPLLSTGLWLARHRDRLRNMA